MSEPSDKAKALLDYCKENGRFCPQPQHWNRLWEMLPGRTRKPTRGWNPSPPLILTAWDNATGQDKLLRLRDHIGWADAHGVIDDVDAYLREMTEEQWFHGRDWD